MRRRFPVAGTQTMAPQSHGGRGISQGASDQDGVTGAENGEQPGWLSSLRRLDAANVLSAIDRFQDPLERGWNRDSEGKGRKLHA